MKAILSAAVFIDRDGVLDEVVVDGDGDERPPWSLGELVVARGALEACCALQAAGYLLIGVTNQPDIARGRVDRDTVDVINDALVVELGLTHLAMCPHDGRDRCRCRKPSPGLIVDAAARHSVDLRRSWTVGDRWVDIAAGRAAGTATILVDRPSSWAATSAGRPPVDLAPDHRVADLLGASALITAWGGHRFGLEHGG